MQNVLPYLLQASGCMAVLLLLYWLLLKRETFFSFNRWYLVGGLVLATVLPHIGLPATQAPLYVTPALMATVELPALTAITASTESTTGWTDRLMALYGVGVFSLRCVWCTGCTACGN